jgi:hypothetical protein
MKKVRAPALRIREIAIEFIDSTVKNTRPRVPRVSRVRGGAYARTATRTHDLITGAFFRVCLERLYKLFDYGRKASSGAGNATGSKSLFIVPLRSSPPPPPRPLPLPRDPPR